MQTDEERLWRRCDEEDFCDIFIQVQTRNGSKSIHEHHRLKDGYEIVLTTRRKGGRIYARARKRKIPDDESC